MNRSILIVGAALILIALVGGVVYYNNRPTALSGDPWNYALTQDDLSTGWEVGSNKIETAFDIQRDAQTQPEGLQRVYSIEFTHPTKVDVFNITSQVLLYDSTAAAQKALSAENPGAEWEATTATQTVGEATLVWHLKPVDDAPEQAGYRVDFRYLNGIASVGVIGTTDGMKDASTALNYAAKILEKMQAGAKPEALTALGNRPDLRRLLLTQPDLAQLDSRFGDQWVYNSLLTPNWTPNSAFDNPVGMEKLGRLMGSQAWLFKPLVSKDLKPGTTVTLFQQVTVFQTSDNAQATLDKMEGLGSGVWDKAPAIGEAAKGWTQLFNIQESATGSGVVPTTEISFRVGIYTGSIRVQTTPTQEVALPIAQAANEALASQLAQALAAKLQNAGK